MSLRPYQAAAVEGVRAAWREHRSTLLVLPTGAGKTYTAATIVAERARHGRVLWLAHRTELLSQAIATMQRLGLTVELEQADARAGRLVGGQVVCASVPSMRGRRLASWPTAAFSTIVVDEAHHATASTYLGILEHFADALVLGLTATPDRTDKVGLGEVFENCAYEYPIRTAIEDGWLVPPVSRGVDLPDLDLRGLRVRAGDIEQGALEERVIESLEQIVGPLIEHAEDRQSLLFVPGVRAAHLAVELLERAHVAAAAIDGTTPDAVRRETLDAYRAGRVRVLANFGVLTEGTDLPMASCVAMARPTTSRSLYAQMLGRGLRPLSGIVDGLDTAEERLAAIAASAAPDCLVLDYRPTAGDLALVGPADVLAGEPIPDAVRRKLRDGNALDALDAAHAEVLEDERREREEQARQRAEAEAEREERARRDLERGTRRGPAERPDVAHRLRPIDLFADAACPLGVTVGRDRGPRLTDRQREAIRRAGIEIGPSAASRREASQLLDALRARHTAGLASLKQVRAIDRTLSRHGVTVPIDLPAAVAKRTLDYLSSHGWRPSAEMVDWYRRQYMSAEAAE